MLRPRSRTFNVVVLAAIVVLSGNCIWIAHGMRVTPVDPRSDSVLVRSPVKAHLLDGSTIIFRNGVLLAHDTLRGKGVHFDANLGTGPQLARVPAESVAAMESFDTYVNGGQSLTMSAFMTVLVFGGLAGAIASSGGFGSCPTVYSDSAGTLALDAEPFPNSIVPLFERRDVQRLRAQPGPDGILHLEVRNEALETHYFNHMELLAVEHAPDELVLPDGGYNLLAVRDRVRLTTAVDRAGRDVLPAMMSDDGSAFRTAPAILQSVAAGDMTDYIEIAAPIPVGTDSVALVLHLRNSLFSTMMLYDMMLAERGMRALDWLGEDMTRIDNAVALGRWFHERMGMQIAVLRDGDWVTAAQVPNVGPIAWRRVAAVIRAPREDTLHVRLTFLADQWRIQSLGVATGVRVVKGRRIAVSRVVPAGGEPNSEALLALARPDVGYLQTGPGQRFTVDFATGVAPGSVSRTFLLASQGYYREWVHGDWIRTTSRPQEFVPSDSTLFVALQRWNAVQRPFEQRFAAIGHPER